VLPKLNGNLWIDNVKLKVDKGFGREGWWNAHTAQVLV
jgi:hypothetical protein